MPTPVLPPVVADRCLDLGHGDWIHLLRANGFEVQDLIGLWPPEGTDKDGGFVTAEWARRWPSEEVWRARRR